MHLSRACLGDIAHVLRCPSRQTELDLASIDFTPWEAFDLLKDRLDGAVTLVLDDKPACVFGLVDETADVWMTWFIAAQSYFDGGLPVLRFSRKYLAERFKGRTVLMISHSPHPDAPKWFKLMGYVLESEKDGEKVYSYKHR